MIGRSVELKLLKNDFQASSSSILVCYGRRRIGKSYLIENYIKDVSSNKKGLTPSSFQFEGIEGQTQRFQVRSFYNRLIDVFKLKKDKLIPPKNWEEALSLLTKSLPKSRDKFIIYFDEFQWMANGRSTLPALIKTFWDTKWNSKKIQLILCGSVSSYMIGKVIKSKALYGRIRYELNINFLSIKECQGFFKKEKSHLEIIKYLLIFGGVPKYLSDLNHSQSFDENIESLCFNPNSSYMNEFEKVFYSQFKEHRVYEKIVKELSKQTLNLEALSKKVEIKSGGGLKFYLTNLEQAQFIKSYFSNPRNINSKIKHYKLTDPFLRFYFEFIAPHKNLIAIKKNPKEIRESVFKSKWDIFLGLGFENFCLINAMEIAKHFKIQSRVAFYGPIFIQNSAQIDLAYFRDDNVIHLVEVKFTKQDVDVSVIPSVEKKVEWLRVFFPNYSISKNLITLSPASKKLRMSEYFDQIITINDLLSGG